MKLSFSIKDAADHTGIGRTKIYQAINQGDLKARKFGKRTLILREDLVNFLDNLASYEGGQHG